MLSALNVIILAAILLSAAYAVTARSGGIFRVAAGILCGALAGEALVAGAWVGVPVAVVVMAVLVQLMKAREVGVPGAGAGVWGALLGAAVAYAVSPVMGSCPQASIRAAAPSPGALGAVAMAALGVLTVQGVHRH